MCDRGTWSTQTELVDVSDSRLACWMTAIAFVACFVALCIAAAAVIL